MQKIQFIADKNQLHLAGLDVAVVGLGDMSRLQALAPGQWAIVVGARGGSMWQVISRPFPSREAAKEAKTSGFVPLDTDVATRWARSLLASRVVRLVDDGVNHPVNIEVRGRPRHAERLEAAHKEAERRFGVLKVGNPPEKSENPTFWVFNVEEQAATAYVEWFIDTFGSKPWSPKCEVTMVAAHTMGGT